MLAVTLFSCAAAADLVFGLGWGYEPKDLGIGLAMVLFGGLMLLFFRFIERATLAIARSIHGPEPGIGDES